MRNQLYDLPFTACWTSTLQLPVTTLREDRGDTLRDHTMPSLLRNVHTARREQPE